MAEGPRLALFSPVPPVVSGIADYLVDLLPHLPSEWTIDLFVDDGVEPTGRFVEMLGDRGDWLPHGAFSARHAERPYDLPVYQVGNHVAHEYIFPYVLESPGLLVLHDGVVHPARAQAAIEGGRIGDYRRAVAAARPDVGAALGHLVAGGLGGQRLFFTFPLCEDLVGASRVTGVHGAALVSWLRALVPDASVQELVHWRAVPEAEEARIEAWRSRLGASGSPKGEGPVTVGCFGHIGAARRLDRIVDALAALGDPDSFFLVVVGSVDASLRLPELVDRRGLTGRVHWAGHVSKEDFAALLRTVDLAVNLRYPLARASSGVLHQLLQVGVPTIISDLVHWADYPDDAVARVPPGPEAAEQEALSRILGEWIDSPERRRKAGARARRWAAARLTPEAAADSWAAAVELALSAGPDAASRQV